MAYMVFTSATTSNPDQLGEDYLRLGGDILKGAGATRLAVSQSIAAGEGTGAVTVTSIWDSLDAAMTALTGFRADNAVQASMKANEVVPISRVVTVIDEERGTPEGAFVGATFGAATSPDPSRTTELADVSGELMTGAGCNGVRLVTAVAAGEQTGMVIGLVYTDSLDAWAAGQKAAAGSDALQGLFRTLGMQIGGRIISRVIGTA